MNKLMKHLAWGSATLFAALLLLSGPAAAQALDSGDTAWMLTSTALVLLMTIPGLALFYGGMVRKKKCSGNNGAMLCHCRTFLRTVDGRGL